MGQTKKKMKQAKSDIQAAAWKLVQQKLMEAKEAKEEGEVEKKKKKKRASRKKQNNETPTP